MSSIQERLQLKRVPLDTWNIREQLCLASAVVRSGDQNWMSVSRALKTVGEANRPPDWYSQKSCAAQYGALLEHVETPKRKKRSSEGAVETPQESILKRLTQERIVEIQKTVAEMNQHYEQLKNEINEARNPNTSDDRLREMWAEIEAAKRTRERENARRAAWLKEREERRARAERTWRPPHAPHTSPPSAPAGAVTPSPAPPSSPLLTSLLKSSPVVTTPQHITHPANVVETVSPSAGAPTLSMLLEKPGGSSPHENKHAAIEHIKSQLVQIEQQLKASSATPPPVVPALPAVDIDDIEIKAEDVYAFRDIDINIPPVTALHKPPSRDKPVKKDEQEAAPAVGYDQQPNSAEEMKAEPEDMAIDVETVAPPDNTAIEEPAPAAPVVMTIEPESEPAGLPEVRLGFPAPEIKVLGDTDSAKEEVKEEDLLSKAQEEPSHEVSEEVNVEDIPPPREPTPAPPADTPADTPTQAADTPAEPPEEPAPDPADIPLPDNEPEHAQAEESLPPEPIAPQEQVEDKENEETVAEETAAPPPETEQVAEENSTEDVKKDDDAEDSLPLKEMIREESARKSELEPEMKVEPQPEPEETHTETDDDTPMELSREEEKDGKKKRDYSRKKKPDSRTCSGSESAAEASAPESPGGGGGTGGVASEQERQHRLWKKSVMLVYSRLCAHKYASIFLRPISDEEAPGYSLVVKRPMDLTSIRRNIDAGNIRTTAEFQRDVLLMLSNALIYNHSEHSVYMMAKEMFQEASLQLHMLVAAQAHASLVGGPPAPPRRKRRRPHEPASSPAAGSPAAAPSATKRTH